MNILQCIHSVVNWQVVSSCFLSWAMLLWTFLCLFLSIFAIIFITNKNLGYISKGGMGMIIGDVHFQLYNLILNTAVKQMSSPTVGGWTCLRWVLCVHCFLALNVTCEEGWVLLVFAPLEWFAFSLKCLKNFFFIIEVHNFIRLYVGI